MTKQRKIISILGRKHGFTLTEVIIVMALLVIMAAIAIPNIISSLPDMRLKAAARELYMNLQKAKMTAVKFNRDTAVMFNPANKKYIICDQWTAGSCTGEMQTIKFSSMKSGIGYGHGDSTEQANGNDWPLSPDDNVSYTSPDNVVVFNSLGTCSNTGYVYIDHEKHTTTYTVGTLLSGSVRLLRWNESTMKWE
jgi:prepilin-type N-terminal cleavage/methylation domain-containing protein